MRGTEVCVAATIGMVKIPRRERMNPPTATGAAGETCVDEALGAGAGLSMAPVVAALVGCGLLALAAVAAALPIAC
ncbi:MAG TPA: hypothetical protein VN255_01165 [Mycobacterium sp.]|nr:hypothetical protein [Mycobacterium sp.]HWT47237.1 hypothetical protein [Mycobacterium sp.]